MQKMRVNLYERMELSYQVKINTNPFKIVFYAIVCCPNGEKKKIDGFYDGSDIFCLRFMPEIKGNYSLKTFSKLKELNGKIIDFECIDPLPNSHGRVVVKDKYWFEYCDKSPYFEAGTTCYAWIHQNQEVQQETLTTLAKGYFNKIRMCVFPKWYVFNKVEPSIYPFEGTLNNFDYSKPNIQFFKHLESNIDKLNQMGIEVDLILFHPYDKDEWGFSNMMKEQDIAYLKYVIARLSSFSNVWWSIANEYDLLTKGYKKHSSSWNYLLEYVHKNDPYHHLMSIHQCNKMFDHRKKYITHCSIQRQEIYITAENVEYWIKKYKKPVIIDECGYEGNLPYNWGCLSGQELVRRFWEATTRGGYLGHGETFLNDSQNLWWAHGGKLYGESADRIEFLKDIFSSLEDIRLVSHSGRTDFVNSKANKKTYLTYFGYHQLHNYDLFLSKNYKYEIKIIDTWNMKINKLEGLYNGKINIELPSKPYIALLAIGRTDENLKNNMYEDDIPFSDTVDKKGGRRLLKLISFVLKMIGKSDIYGYVEDLSVNQISEIMKLNDKKKEKFLKGIRYIIDDNKMLKGMINIIKSFN